MIKKKFKFNDNSKTIFSGYIILATQDLKANHPTITIVYLVKRTEHIRERTFTYSKQDVMQSDYDRLLKSNHLY